MDDLQEVAVMLETGIKAPEFTLKNQDGEEVSLKDFLRLVQTWGLCANPFCLVDWKTLLTTSTGKIII